MSQGSVASSPRSYLPRAAILHPRKSLPKQAWTFKRRLLAIISTPIAAKLNPMCYMLKIPRLPLKGSCSFSLIHSLSQLSPTTRVSYRPCPDGIWNHYLSSQVCVSIPGTDYFLFCPPLPLSMVRVLTTYQSFKICLQKQNSPCLP